MVEKIGWKSPKKLNLEALKTEISKFVVIYKKNSKKSKKILQNPLHILKKSFIIYTKVEQKGAEWCLVVQNALKTRL